MHLGLRKMTVKKRVISVIRHSASEWRVGLLSVNKFFVCYYLASKTNQPVNRNVRNLTIKSVSSMESKGSSKMALVQL